MKEKGKKNDTRDGTEKMLTGETRKLVLLQTLFFTDFQIAQISFFFGGGGCGRVSLTGTGGKRVGCFPCIVSANGMALQYSICTMPCL